MKNRLTFHKVRNPRNQHAPIWHLLLNGKRVPKTCIKAATYYEAPTHEWPDEVMDRHDILYYEIMHKGNFTQEIYLTLVEAKNVLVVVFNEHS